jgi:hypothetical protein
MKKKLFLMKEYVVKHHSYFLALGFILFLFGIILAIISPNIWEVYNLTETGQIGDTIGGITAPFINLLGALLVYISFKEQNKANKIQAEQNAFNLLHELYKELKAEFENLKFSSKNVQNGQIYSGSKAQSVFIEILTSRVVNEDFKKNSFFKEYLFLMGNMGIFLDIVEESNASEKEKIYILRLFHFLYLAKIKSPLIEIIKITDSRIIHKEFNLFLVETNNKVEGNYKVNFPE